MQLVRVVGDKLATFTATNARPKIWGLLQEDLAAAADHKPVI